MEFKYQVSVIVPVYNVEAYLPRCLDSLVNQTIDKNAMEVLVINDGSPDNSLSIAEDYARRYSFIKVFSKENEGLSATRNFGIQHAQGKYLMFLDSDDYFSPDTVKGVSDFFDTVYDVVDVVTYYMQPFTTGRILPSHIRFTYYLKASGIYDLKKYPYILQMNINVCVKNLGDENVLFDTTPGFRQEDQEYNNRVLMRKMKIGYSQIGCYYYNKANENSIVTTLFNSINLFEKSMTYLEQLMAHFPQQVPKYFQAVVFHDLRWKLDQGILLPYHYSPEDFDAAVARIKALLARINNSTIIEYPDIKEHVKIFWLSFKDNANIIPLVRRNKLLLLSGGKIIYKRTKMDVVVTKFQVLDNGHLLVRGFLDTAIYNFIRETPEIYVIENETTKKRLPAYLSIFGCKIPYLQMVNNYAFEYELDPDTVQSFRFQVHLDGFDLVSNYSFKQMSGMNLSRKRFDVIYGRTLVRFRNTQFYVSRVTGAQRDAHELAQAFGYAKDPEVAELKQRAIAYRREHNVWLYSDLYTVRKDNAYDQFINDFGKDDGVDRYYVYTRPYVDIVDLFTPEQQKFLVEFGSEQHKLLYLSSELILSGFFGRSPISPFPEEREEVDYYDIEHFRVIYLQHGVLHAALRVQNSAENAKADKIVISSDFERRNLTENYHYRPDALIPSGMSRYDHIDRSKPPKGRILFAPSWRNYFAANVTASRWETDLAVMRKSEYFRNITAFLESEVLAEALNRSGIVLEVKLHPIIADTAKDLFNFKTDKIVMAEKNVEVTDYDMFITDFSSFVFDYACLSRPILYFVPDYLQFKSGMGHYKDLDLPFDKAFGPFTTDPAQAAALVAQEIADGFAVDPVFKTRMDQFFVPLDHCADRLYDYICREMLPEMRREAE